MQQARVGSGRRLVASAAVVIGLAVLGAPATSAVAATKSFKPAKLTRKALVFKPDGLEAKKVRRAKAKVRVVRGNGRRATVKRKVNKRKVRRQLRRAARGERAKIKVKVKHVRKVAKGKLKVKGPFSDSPTDPSSTDSSSTDSSSTDGSSPAPSPSDGGAVCAPTPELMRAIGCETLLGDTGVSDPVSTWGAIECQSAERHSLVGSGDPAPTAGGLAQGDGTARRLTVRDGDDFYGRRCELGRNDHRKSPTALYREGQRRLTFISLRLTDSFPIDTSRWQTVVQMKQTQPSAGGGGGPILELQAYAGRFWLVNDWQELWSAPASVGAWTRFAFDVRYSRDAAKGRVTLYVDLNGDGDANDDGERSPTFEVSTLKTEIEGGWDGDGIEPGESIPSHLRTGIYHNREISCPSGCAIDVDNVQVVAAD